MRNQGCAVKNILSSYPSYLITTFTSSTPNAGTTPPPCLHFLYSVWQAHPLLLLPLSLFLSLWEKSNCQRFPLSFSCSLLLSLTHGELFLFSSRFAFSSMFNVRIAYIFLLRSPLSLPSPSEQKPSVLMLSGSVPKGATAQQLGESMDTKGCAARDNFLL